MSFQVEQIVSNKDNNRRTHSYLTEFVSVVKTINNRLVNKLKDNGFIVFGEVNGINIVKKNNPNANVDYIKKMINMCFEYDDKYMKYIQVTETKESVIISFNRI
ncbi:MAG: hypothetical protein PHF63_00820 [Herbinix sp.]|nr:hypothetical protein [Herbinix sp.]